MAPRTCDVADCDRPRHGHGLCQHHYDKQRVTRCLQPGCTEPTARGRRGTCTTHSGATGDCSVDGCARAAHCRHLCITHYHRFLDHGTVELPARVSAFDAPLADRFHQFVKVLGDDDCWPWRGSINPNGYGQLNGLTPDRRKTTFRAHRVAYEVYVGAIPDGLTIDHLCFHRWCCNPAHLEPVTQAENNRRASERRARAAA